MSHVTFYTSGATLLPFGSDRVAVKLEGTLKELIEDAELEGAYVIGDDDLLKLVDDIDEVIKCFGATEILENMSTSRIIKYLESKGFEVR